MQIHFFNVFIHLSCVRDGHFCLFLHPIVSKDSLSVFLQRFLFSSSHTSILANLLGSETGRQRCVWEIVFTTDKESGASKGSTQQVTLANAFHQQTRRQLTKVMTRTFLHFKCNSCHKNSTQSRNIWGTTGSDCCKCFPEADAATTADESYGGDFPASRVSREGESMFTKRRQTQHLREEKIHLRSGKWKPPPALLVAKLTTQGSSDFSPSQSSLKSPWLKFLWLWCPSWNEIYTRLS